MIILLLLKTHINTQSSYLLNETLNKIDTFSIKMCGENKTTVFKQLYVNIIICILAMGLPLDMTLILLVLNAILSQCLINDLYEDEHTK